MAKGVSWPRSTTSPEEVASSPVHAVPASRRRRGRSPAVQLPLREDEPGADQSSEPTLRLPDEIQSRLPRADCSPGAVSSPLQEAQGLRDLVAHRTGLPVWAGRLGPQDGMDQGTVPASETSARFRRTRCPRRGSVPGRTLIRARSSTGSSRGPVPRARLDRACPDARRPGASRPSASSPSCPGWS